MPSSFCVVSVFVTLFLGGIILFLYVVGMTNNVFKYILKIYTCEALRTKAQRMTLLAFFFDNETRRQGR